MTFAEQFQAPLDGPWTDIQRHLPYLYQAACRYPAVRVLELGVRDGQSTRAFLAAAEKTGGHVWSCDISEPQVPAGWAGSGLWTFTRGDDRRLAHDRPVDVLFVDTSHEYQHTLHELDRFMPLVVPGGTALFHDTQWGTWRDACAVPGAYGPVACALDTWCEQRGLTWALHPGSFGLGEIRV